MDPSGTTFASPCLMILSTQASSRSSCEPVFQKVSIHHPTDPEFSPLLPTARDDLLVHLTLVILHVFQFTTPTTRFHTTPQLNKDRQAKEDLERVPFFYEPLRRSKVAAEWLKRETPQLVLPLTVQTELSIAEQFCTGLWTDWTDLGLVSSQQQIQPGDAERLYQELPKAMAALLPTVPKLEKEPVVVALNACSSTNFINRFSTDLRIYMEACLYSASRGSSCPVMSLVRFQQICRVPCIT